VIPNLLCLNLKVLGISWAGNIGWQLAVHVQEAWSLHELSKRKFNTSIVRFEFGIKHVLSKLEAKQVMHLCGLHNQCSHVFIREGTKVEHLIDKLLLLLLNLVFNELLVGLLCVLLLLHYTAIVEDTEGYCSVVLCFKFSTFIYTEVLSVAACSRMLQKKSVVKSNN